MKMKTLMPAALSALALIACSDTSDKIEDTETGVSQSDQTQAVSGPTFAACEFPITPPAAIAPQTDFDTYSWNMFVALNWVNDLTQRGVPNCSLPITAPGPRVWESWKTVEQVFLPGAVDPGTWNNGWGPVLPMQLSAKSKLSPGATFGLGNIPSPESTILQPVGGWLIDQRGNPTYYQISSNETSYNYIVNNDLYNATTASTFHPVDFPWQSTEIKASWRILTSDDDASRYLTTEAKVAEYNDQGQPTGGYSDATIGLVGLHIINKAPGFPQWIWATFEQIDNVDPSANFAPYYDATAQNPNTSPCKDRAVPCVPIPPATFQTPDPLTRLTPIASTTQTVNSTYQSTYSGTFLEHYQLITTQRPNDPNDPGNPLGTPTPNIAANVTLESYIQPTSSCMACHQTASAVGSPYKSDFSFLLLHAQEPPVVSN